MVMMLRPILSPVFLTGRLFRRGAVAHMASSPLVTAGSWSVVWSGVEGIETPSTITKSTGLSVASPAAVVFTAVS